jgi:diacylglycerol kinase (ATP)
MPAGSGGGAGQLAAFVVNAAHPLRPPDLRARLAAATLARGWAEPLVLMTTPQDSGAGLARQALAAGAVVVFAVGGDGTVRACAAALAGSGVPLAIVPAGSANLTANALKIPARLTQALAAGFGGRDRQIDLGVADGAVFTAMAGIGIDAAVVGATTHAAKTLAGWPAYAAAAATQLRRPPAVFSVRLDGGEPVLALARSVAVGNCGLLPGGFAIMPDARLDDGLLDVAILAPAGLRGWASVGIRAATGSRREDGQLARYQARRVEIRASARQPRQADGELIGAGYSLTVQVRPGALLVRVPPGPAR